MAFERGERRHSAKLTEADVLEIRRRHGDGRRLVDLARDFPQCSKVNLHHIIHGRSWKYLLPVQESE
jgi:hypothetical protein